MASAAIVFEGRTYRVSGGYYKCHDKWKATPRALHRDIWVKEYGPIPKGCEIHHIDGDKQNNNINNLGLLSSSEHARLHGLHSVWAVSPRNINDVLPGARDKSHIARRQPENRIRNAERWKTNTKIHEWIKSQGALDALKKARPLAKAWHSSTAGKAWHSEHSKLLCANRKPVLCICTFCGNEYFTVYPQISKFCHQNCKAKARRSRIAAGL